MPAGINAERDIQWLLIEWRDGETEPSNYFFATLPEHIDFEGRGFPGWHHHVSVALCCYAFIVAERVRCFPPSAGRPLEDDPDPLAARATLLRQLHHRSALHRAKRRFMAPSMPRLSSSKELVTQ